MKLKNLLFFSVLAVLFLIDTRVAGAQSAPESRAQPQAEPQTQAPTTAAGTQSLTIDTLIGSLQESKNSPEAIRAKLEPQIATPFKAVKVARKKLGTASTIQITFEMIETKTALAQVTKEGATWATGPLLPDSGQCPINRDWSWSRPKKVIKCSAIAEKCESLQNAQIVGEITCFLDTKEKK